MELFLTERFKKSFQILPVHVRKHFKKRVALFLKDPFHPSLKSHPLKGNLVGLRAFSVVGGYRVVFCFLKKDQAKLIDIGSHDRVYR